MASNTPLTRIDFYYDIISPFAYFAFEQLTRLRQEWRLELNLLPIQQLDVIQKSGNVPPAMIPVKSKYMTKDILRCGKYFDVPIQFSSKFQEVLHGSVVVQRILTALKMEHGEELLEKVTKNCWLRHWSSNRDIMTRESQLELLTENNALTQTQAEAILEKSKSKEVQAVLDATTAAALAAGAFGIPTMIVHDLSGKKKKPELVFGSDRFHILAPMIGQKWTEPKPNPDKRAAAAPQQIKSKL